VIPYVGGALTVASAGWDQWREDAENPDLTTTDRVGRAAGAGVWIGGATMTGAWVGATVGTMLFPGVGTGVGFAIGAGVGLAAGAAANAWTPVKHAFADAGQWTANQAVDIGHDIGSGLHSVTKHLPDLNPF
jgi:hypothetical protein